MPVDKTYMKGNLSQNSLRFMISLSGHTWNKERWPGGVERGRYSVVTPRTKRGDQEVLRGAGTQWSLLEQREAARRC